MMSEVEVVPTERVSNPTWHAYERRPIDVFTKRGAGSRRHDRVARQSSSCDVLCERNPTSERKHKNKQRRLHRAWPQSINGALTSISRRGRRHDYDACHDE